MELRRRRGTATFVIYPIVDASGNIVSGVTGIAPQYATFSDASVLTSGFANIAGGCLEIGSTGWYYSSLSASETAFDYLLFHASPTSGNGKRAALLINCTPVASVSRVSAPVPLDWASITSPNTAQNLSQTRFASVNNPVALNWGSITNVAAAVNFSMTQVASVNNPVALNWGSITNQSASVDLANTQIATADGITSSIATVQGITSSVAIDWNRVVNPTTSVDLSNTQIATADGITSTVSPDWGRIANQGSFATLTGTSIATVQNPVALNWASISSPGATVDLSNTEIATADGITSSVAVDWNRTVNQTASVDLSNTQIATVDGVTSTVSPDWNRVVNPTSTVDLTNTTVSTATHVEDLSSTAYPEPSGVPAASTSLKNKLNWMQALARNHITISSVTQTLWNDTSTSTISVATHSDANSLFTRNEWT